MHGTMRFKNLNMTREAADMHETYAYCASFCKDIIR